MALEQDSGCCLNLTDSEDITNNLDSIKNLINGDVTSLNHRKESVEEEQKDFVINKSPEQEDVKTEASGHSDKDDCKNEAVNIETSESDKENHTNVVDDVTLSGDMSRSTDPVDLDNFVIKKPDNINSVDDATLSEGIPNFGLDLEESASLSKAKCESKTEPVEKSKDLCDKRQKQVLSDDKKANDESQVVQQAENINCLTNLKVSFHKENVSDSGKADETKTSITVDSLELHKQDGNTEVINNMPVAVSDMINLLKNMKTDQEKGDDEIFKTGQDDGPCSTFKTNSSIKENEETCGQGKTKMNTVNEECKNTIEKKDGKIEAKQRLEYIKERTAEFMRERKTASLGTKDNETTKFQEISPDIPWAVKYADILERINQVVMPLHKQLFPGRSTPTLTQHSSSSIIHKYEETSKTMQHSNKQQSRDKTKSKLSGKCLIHSIPKLMMCLDCQQKQCSQCVLVDGICRDHKLAEAPHLAAQREKVKLMKALETASHDLNQSDVYMKTVETDLQNIEVNHLLRREEIHQEFTSFMDLLIQQKQSVLQALDQEAEQRRRCLEDILEKHRALQQKEGQLTDDIMSLVQDTGTLDQCHELQSECEKFSSSVKSTLISESPPITSLLDNPFSLYREKTNFLNAMARNDSKCGDISFRQKTIHVNADDQAIMLEQLLDVPCYSASSTQTYTVELLKFPRTKVWETSVPTLKGLVLNCDTTYCFESNVTYLLRVTVCLSIEQSAITKVERVGKPTHLMIICSGQSVPEDEQYDMRKSTMEETPNATPSTSMTSSLMGSLTNISEADKAAFEAEKMRVYQQLDDKDDEINNQAQMIEKLNQQLMEQEELISNARRDNDLLQQEVGRISADNDSAKDEVKEVLQALTELAMNYDQKSQEVDTKNKENEALNDELSQKLSLLNSLQSELDSLKDSSLHQRRRITDMMMSLLRDLSDIGTIVGGNSAETKMAMGNSEKVEEEFTVARLYISKMKSEVKTLVTRAQSLDTMQTDTNKKLEAAETELSDCRLLIQQHEAKMKSLTETIQDIESKKRKLEENVDSLNENMAALKASEEVHLSAQQDATESLQSASEMKAALESQLDKHREQHQKQLSSLRDKIANKQTLMDQLKDTNQKLSLALEKLQSDYDKLKHEETEKTAKLAELSLQIDCREQAKQDLKGLEETVAKELQTLHNLKKLFVQDLQNRVRKSTMKKDDDEEEDVGGSAAQKQKISFLENNLEQLAKVHKQLVRDNADLRCEQPKLEKRLRATMDRVKSLETALKDAKEGAMRDRKRWREAELHQFRS